MLTNPEIWIPTTLVVALLMEPWSRVVHNHIWHGFLWRVHRSHHRLQPGWEANDIFGILHAIPAAAMIVWGTLGPTIFRQVVFGIGLGMTFFGLSYMLVHDGYIHGRLPMGFLDRFAWMRRIKHAHGVHHQTNRAPYGLFLGPQEIAGQDNVPTQLPKAWRR